LTVEQRKAVVLLSGGMDSCVCTAIARERHGAGNVALLHAMYGQRTEKRETSMACASAWS
jgi:7-cyano-7-deazaguanine synthase